MNLELFLILKLIWTLILSWSFGNPFNSMVRLILKLGILGSISTGFNKWSGVNETTFRALKTTTEFSNGAPTAKDLSVRFC